MTKNQMNTIKKSILDAVMTYCDIKIANAQYAFTEIGVVTDTDYVHYTNTVNIKGAIYTSVLSVGKIVYPKDSVVYCFVPNNQYNNMFILGKLDASPANIEGGEIHIGETGKQNDDGSMKYYFNVDKNGNVEITQGSINLGLNSDGTYNFSVDNDGNMIARDGYFTGDIVGSSISSSDGTFAIDENGNIIGADIVGSSLSSTNGTFSIDKDGNIIGADIVGSSLSSTNGTFSIDKDGNIIGADIVGSSLSSTNGTFSIDKDGNIIGASISGSSIEIGNESGSYYFGVDTNGEVTIVGANISGYVTDGEVASEIAVLPHSIGLFSGDGSITITTYDGNGNSIGTSQTDISIYADNIKFDAHHRLTLNAGEFVFNGENFSLDETGNATFTGTVGASALKLGETEVAQAYENPASGNVSCFFPCGASFGGNYDSPDVSISDIGNGIETSHIWITNGSSGISNGQFYLGESLKYAINSNGNGHFNQVWTNEIETSHIKITNGSSGISSGRFYLGGTSGSYYVGSDGACAFKSLTTDSGTVSTSDKKEKTHIKYLSEDNKIKDFIMSLRPVEYKWKDNGKRTHLGFYAQDVQQEALSTIGDTGLYCAAHYKKDDNGEPIDTGYTSDTPDEELSWGLRYTEFIAPMVSMIQMQQKQIDELQSQIQRLQERNEK